MGVKMDGLIALLKQPSTMKGILGLLTIVATKFGLATLVSPEEYVNILEGVAAIYFCISIFLQKT
jgi:hypothetical protein